MGRKTFNKLVGFEAMSDLTSRVEIGGQQSSSTKA
jgi:hypothetical protein